MAEFCDLAQPESGGTKCRRCGCWALNGAPTCPPWLTRSEPDNARLPHITTSAENQAAYDAWFEEQWELERMCLGLPYDG